MNKKILSFALLSLLLIAAYPPLVSALPLNGTDTTALIVDTISEPETSDPAWAYDTASAGMLINIYEPLAMCKVDRTLGPYDAGLVDEFEGMVAKSWLMVSKKTYLTADAKIGAKTIHVVTTVGKYKIGDTIRISNDIADTTTEDRVIKGLTQTTITFAVPLTKKFVAPPRGVAKVAGIVDTVTGILIKNNFYFEIRVGIPFHLGGTGTNWGILTTEDVEYSFERMMVQDRDGGPQWMLYNYLLNAYGASAPMDDPLWGIKIDHAVDHDATKVWFNIATDFDETTIMQINTHFGIVCKAWAQSTGLDKLGNTGDLTVEDVYGGWSNWQVIWDRYHNPATSIIEYDEADAATKPVGTGPYKFSYWNFGSSWSITKFDQYWGGWPSRVMEAPGPDSNPNRLTGFLTTVTWYLYTQWPTRRPRFLSGASDMTYVDRLYNGQVLGTPGIRCYYPFDVLALDAFFFTFDITTTSPYVPNFLPSGTFGTNGIPPDLFSDVNVRKGFAYAFDYPTYLASAYPGEGWQPPDAVIRGIAYNRRNVENPYYPGDEETDPIPTPNNLRYYYNLGLATYYLQLAYGGQDTIPGNGVVEVPGALWNGGMKFRIVYNTGNVARQLAAEMITNKINSLGNPLFQLDPPFAAAWGSVMLPQMVNGELPIFLIGWAADYPDPHNFVYPFYHSTGTFAQYQKYNNPAMDNLIETGINTPSGAARSAIYQQIQELAITDAPSVPLVQALGRHWEREWVRGWYYNPLYGGSLSPGIDSTAPESPVFYAYHLWKALSEFGDATNDGNEDIADKAYMAAHWTDTPGALFNPSADISGGTGGTVGGGSGLIVGIPDGVVDVVDDAVLNRDWD